MSFVSRAAVFIGWIVAAPLGSGCVTTVIHPCTTAKAGQPAHDDGKMTKGTKQCVQSRVSGGGYINHGKYTEWHPNGVRALEGEYASGLKTGKWIEWDDQGKLLSEKWYESGQLVPGREAQSYNGLGIAPLPKTKPVTTQIPVPASSPR